MSEQEKREAVIKGLEEVKGFIKSENSPAHSLKALLNIDDAIVLLKAQEPRVMTESELDEYISSFDGEAAIWIEHKTLGLHCATLWSNNPSRSGKDFYDIRYECYYERSAIGSHWRPWTRRPSDAQRGATPWG